jgi:MFS family permease
MAKTQETPSFIISIRFLLAILAFIAYAAQYTQKINMSVAIVCMIRHNDTTPLPEQNNDNSHLNDTLAFDSSSSSVCEASVSKKKHSDNGEFYWNKQTQGLILSFYFVGYLLTEIPGGWLSLKFGSKIVLAVAILVSSVLTLLLPFAARIHVGMLIACRFLIGLAHGVVWPAFSGFWVECFFFFSIKNA